MSAYMVSKEHIDRLVATAIDGPIDGPNVSRWHDIMRWNLSQVPGVVDAQLRIGDAANVLGDILVKENLSSIHARYPDTIARPEDTPGPIDQYWLIDYRLPDTVARLTILQAFKAIDCYEYQACEHAEWEGSNARKFCQRFKDNLIGVLPGYEEADWELEAV